MMAVAKELLSCHRLYKNNRTVEQYFHKGFILAALLLLDANTSRRWEYWLKACDKGALPADPIPQIDWLKYLGTPENRAAAADLLKCCEQGEANQFLDWLLHGFGYDAPPSWADADIRTLEHWEKHFGDAFPAMMLYPAAYFTDLLQEIISKYKRSNTGCFPTPMHVSVCMAEMTFSDNPRGKAASVCDPCCGAGNMLLAASNYSLNLYGQDINELLLKGLKVQAFMYVPWIMLMPDHIQKLFEEAN